VGGEDELHALGDEGLADGLPRDAALGQILDGAVCGPRRLLHLRGVWNCNTESDSIAGALCAE